MANYNKLPKYSQPVNHQINAKGGFCSRITSLSQFFSLWFISMFDSFPLLLSAFSWSSLSWCCQKNEEEKRKNKEVRDLWDQKDVGSLVNEAEIFLFTPYISNSLNTIHLFKCFLRSHSLISVTGSIDRRFQITEVPRAVLVRCVHWNIESTLI